MEQPNKSHNDHSKQDEESDCEDCRKQREQNKLLVNMYEKLKHIQTKVERVQNTLKDHLKKTDNDASNIQQMGNKISGIHGDTNQEGTKDEIGLELAKQLIERRQRQKLEQENKQLKEIIRKMRQDQAKQQSIAKESNGFSNATSRIFISERTVQLQHHPANNPEIFTPQTTKDQPQTQYLQSQSTQFLISNHRKEPKKNIIPQLSLWLFDNIENSRLENQLYSHRDMTTKNQSYFEKKSSSRYSRNLPLIRQRSDPKEKDSKLQSTRFQSKKLPVITKRISQRNK